MNNKEMSHEETIKKMFVKLPPGKDLRNQHDIDCFIRDNLPERLPIDGPLIRQYLQDYEPDDQEHLPQD